MHIDLITLTFLLALAFAGGLYAAYQLAKAYALNRVDPDEQFTVPEIATALAVVVVLLQIGRWLP